MPYSLIHVFQVKDTHNVRKLIVSVIRSPPFTLFQTRGRLPVLTLYSMGSPGNTEATCKIPSLILKYVYQSMIKLLVA